MATNLDDTSRCPVAMGCESCDEAEDLDVVTLGTPLGVYCLTLCGTCVAAGRFPTDLVSTAMLVVRHCEHLGLDLDHMAVVRAAEAGS
jgi:hypothetical protein